MTEVSELMPHIVKRSIGTISDLETELGWLQQKYEKALEFIRYIADKPECSPGDCIPCRACFMLVELGEG